MTSEELLKHYYNVHKKDKKLIGIGSSKYCYKAGSKTVLLRLIPRIKNVKDCMPCQTFYQRVQKIRELQKMGVNTPVPLSMMFTEKYGHYYELQEMAQGKAIALFSEKETMLKLFGDEKQEYRFEDMRGELLETFSEKVFEYNIQMQNQLKKAPHTHFVKFLRDYKKINNMGYCVDSHSENIFYHSKEGFSFIDLDVDVHESVKHYNDVVILNEVFMLMDCFNRFTSVMPAKKAETIKENTQRLKLRLLNNTKDAGFKIPEATEEKMRRVLEKSIESRRK